MAVFVNVVVGVLGGTRVGFPFVAADVLDYLRLVVGNVEKVHWHLLTLQRDRCEIGFSS